MQTLIRKTCKEHAGLLTSTIATIIALKLIALAPPLLLGKIVDALNADNHTGLNVLLLLTAGYTLLIAFLMVSRLPVFSGKTVKMRVPPEMVLPVFVSVVFFVALLIGYPWHMLSIGSALYLASLPWGWKTYRDHERNAAAAAAPPPATSDPAAPPPATTFSPPSDDTDGERPVRLN